MSDNTCSTYNDSPGLVKTIAVMTLVNGIVNIFWGLIAIATVTSTFFLWCLAPFAILPTILGVFEIIYAAKLLTDPPQPVQPSQTIAILEILCVLTGNVFSMIVGILSLVFYNDQQVKDYFARLNGMPVTVAPKAPVPPAPPVPVLSPKGVTEPPAEIATEAPAALEPKKPRPRKVAAEKTDADTKSEKPKRTRKSGNSSS
jgi:hypothetical protein